jgi:DNA-directed RNA polymerase subunit RPC12/RpoP
MLFKRCPRCRGDLYREETIRDLELVCLQCGHRETLRMRPPTLIRNAGSARHVEAGVR